MEKSMHIDQHDECGPFDIIGDVHGCASELALLLDMLGYRWSSNGGRRVVFVGDLVDRGPDSGSVLSIAMHMVENGMALCVPGNHDDRLYRYLKGNPVKMKHGLADTLKQLAHITPRRRDSIQHFVGSLPTHLILDGGRLVVAHAGLREDLIGQDSKKAHSFCLYGDTTGEKDGGEPVQLFLTSFFNRAILRRE